MNCNSEQPIAVDLDGSLIKTDLLWESFVLFIKAYPFRVFYIIAWLWQGKAYLKRRLAEFVTIEAATLPYNQSLVNWLQEQAGNGRKIILATASDKSFADAIAKHCGFFHSVLASDGEINLSRKNKANKLVELFGEKGFDYVGNSSDDLDVWHHANAAITVNTSRKVTRRVQKKYQVVEDFSTSGNGIKDVIKALRVHQWVKNILIFLPILAAHEFFNIELISLAVITFVAFSLAASSGYIVNDLLDISDDRHHQLKCKRPFAAGNLSIPVGIVLGVGSLLLALGLSAFVSIETLIVVSLYYAATLSYSLFIKSKVIVDVVFLAGLYTIRIIAGSVATDIELSFWLIILSMFTFLSLAFIKRYSELEKLMKKNATNAKGRGYFVSDAAIIAASGIASGYMSVMVLALYLNSDSVAKYYSNIYLLWLTCPVYLYWISRMWVVTARGEMHFDPIVYALKDRNCILAMLLFVGLLVAAI